MNPNATMQGMPSLMDLFQRAGFTPGDPSYGVPTSMDDEKGQMVFDPITGKIRPKSSLKSNPYGFNLGNLIQPSLDYSGLNQMMPRAASAGGSLMGGGR